MDTDPTNLERITALEKALETAKKETQKYAHELENLRQQYADNLFEERQTNKRLHEEHLRLQRDYSQLRVQKGGFGIKVLVLSGFSRFLTRLVLSTLYWFIFKPKDPNTALFAQFRNEQLFNYERAISAGNFEAVELDLQKNISEEEYKAIRPELEFAKKLVGAARRRCE